MGAAIDVFLHLDDHLKALIQSQGPWVYAILFGVIFAETGLVVTPFLPGDSLLFAAGIFAGTGDLNLVLLMTLLFVAAVLGDTVNYHIGKLVGAKLLERHSRIFKPHHLEKTHAFFERYGGKTIVIARFVPIVRTFAPFVAGMGAMTYKTFLFYNVFGAALWVGICVLAGYFFGGMQIVKDNFELAILAIILLSILPMVVEVVKARRERARLSREG
ncbi:MAG TPA: DedA family protein [Fimbriimonadaceae bacterium]|nr:DedA family protein [Fimbriimonadaceae bacterium]